MVYILIRWITMAIAVGITSWLMPGMDVHQGLWGLVIVSGVLGLINAIIRPIVMFFTCPLVLLTFGLFAIIVNALMLSLTNWLLPNLLTIDSFWTTLFASIFISLIAWVLNLFVHDNSKW